MQDFWTARQKDDSCFEVVEVAEVISWPESHFPTPPLEAIVHGKRMEEGRCLYENESKGILGVRMYLDI